MSHSGKILGGRGEEREGESVKEEQADHQRHIKQSRREGEGYDVDEDSDGGA